MGLRGIEIDITVAVDSHPNAIRVHPLGRQGSPVLAYDAITLQLKAPLLSAAKG